jgi:hypothetical protein
MSMAGIILSFILVTICGNALLASWQHRTWVRQRRFEHRANSVAALKGLFDELASLTNRRRYSMIRVVYALKGRDDDRINLSKQQYQDILDEWNIRFNEILIKLIFHVSTAEMQHLELNINAEFVQIGQRIELCLKSKERCKRQELTDIENKLNRLNRLIFEINRDIYRRVAKIEKREIFSDEKLLTQEEYDEASTWALFRNSFKARI